MSKSTDLTPTEQITEAAEKIGGLDDTNMFAIKMEMLTAVKNYEDSISSIDSRSEGWKFDWSSLGKAIAAEVRIRFWIDVVAQSSPNKEDLVVDLDTFIRLAQYRVTRLLRNEGGTSTSMISNAIDQAEANFTARLVDYFGKTLGLSRF